jgi:hypothetical protein
VQGIRISASREPGFGPDNLIADNPHADVLIF